MKFEILHKQAFTNQLLAQPGNRIPQIIEKIELLRDDPSPHGNVKKKLHGTKGNVYRLRSGDYRILYTYGEGYVSLLGVDDRKDVYDHLGHLVREQPEVALAPTRGMVMMESVEQVEQSPYSRRNKPQGTPLPTKIAEEFLERLRVPEQFFPALCACRTDDDLIAADVPEVVRNRVFDAVMSPDIEEVLAEPSYVTGDTDDLLRFVEGDLLGFLLKLDSVQERLVDWGMKGTGPILVKGGPGTGKSTVALYRVQAMVRAFKASGNPRPRILFTTYTNALVAFSQQLLRRLLGPDATCVEVRTADSVVRWILHALNIHRRILDGRDLQRALEAAIASAGRDGGDARCIARLSHDYILEEVGSVIEAREISSLEQYLSARRAGRRVPLTAAQRTQIWHIYEHLASMLDREGSTTYHRVRRHAAGVVRAGAGPEPYDGVVIDEVQDLDPTVLRLLVSLCAKPNRLFITADANQSIYGSTFRWADVHEDLKFRGRTEVLRTNHRSTREIGEAAQSYLRNGALDEDQEERRYVESGPLPAVRPAVSPPDEARLLASFLTQAARYYRLGIGSGAVLVPTNRTGEAIAARLRECGVQAVFMQGNELDLEKPVVKVLNLKSAKGLEFPIVAIAGFAENPNFGVRYEGEPGEREERLLLERRSMFVGMTRAMRALLIVKPTGRPNPLLQGFDETLWNVRALGAAR